LKHRKLLETKGAAFPTFGATRALENEEKERGIN